MFSYHTTHPRYYFITKHYPEFEEQQGRFLLQIFTSGRATRNVKCTICEKLGVKCNCFSPGIRFTLYLRESALVSPLPNSAGLTKKRKGSQVRQSADAQALPRHSTCGRVSWYLQPLGFSYSLPQISEMSQVCKEDTYTYSLYLLAKTDMKERHD